MASGSDTPQPQLQPQPYEVSCSLRLRTLTFDFVFGGSILAVLSDRFADSLTHSPIVRAACILATLIVMWRTYTSFVHRITLTERELVLTCVRGVVRYSLGDIADVKLSCLPSRGENYIRIKPRAHPWRRRYHCRPHGITSLDLEQELLRQLRARAVSAVSTTRVLWR
jgi:hypothetical protein